MKRSFLHRVSIVVGATALAFAGSSLVASPAHAVNPNFTLTIAGSETLRQFDQALVQSYAPGPGTSNCTNTGATAAIGPVPAGSALCSIPTIQAGVYTVPGDAQCTTGSPTQAGFPDDGTGHLPASAADLDYASAAPPGEVVAPNGSGAGITAVINSGTAGNGCVDIARSSRKKGTAPAEQPLEFYAFALDAISWATTSAYAPPSLDLTQLQQIFTCTVPGGMDWGNVGGVAGHPIAVYAPQSNSGTGATFLTQFLQQPAYGACVHLVEENQAVSIKNGTDFAGEAADYPNVILPYSAGVWNFGFDKQNDASSDLRAGARLGLTSGTTCAGVATPFESTSWNGSNAYRLSVGAAAALVTEANVKLGCNARYLFHAVNPASPSAAQARAFVGNGTGTPVAGTLCAGTKAAVILSNGFRNLPSVGGSACRLNP